MKTLTFGVLTVSDTCSRKEKDDTAGPRLQLEIRKSFPLCKFFKKIVSDDIGQIRDALESWINDECNVIFTVGGTGFAPRDVTPEATRSVIEKEAPGIAYAMISKSLAITDMAMLSRAVCGIKSKSLIINLPGSAKAAVECFGFIKNVLPHAVAVLTDNKELVEDTHKRIQDGDTRHCESTIVDSETTTKSKVKLSVADRNRKSPYQMMEVDEALNKIINEISPSIEREELPFHKSENRILAEDVFADEPVPSFRASIKDGYAVRSSDGAGERIVRNVIAAGDIPFERELQAGEVIRISTGAPIPLGADAVVQVEDTTLIEKSKDGTQERKIKIDVAPTVGKDIREIGSDIAKGELVLKKYKRITAAYIGVLAMLGKTKIKVMKPPSVGILSTGNELKGPYEELAPGQIRDSNKIALVKLLKRYSYESNDCGIAKDNPDSVKFALEKAFASNDIVITTGGVSMGEYDVVKQVLEEDFNAMIHFARVNMKPGKPTTFATLSYEGRLKMVFALPGNPVSCCVTCLLFVIPALKYSERNENYKFPEAVATVSLSNSDPVRPEYHRVRVAFYNDRLSVVSTGNQISSRLNSLAGANGLAVIPPRTGRNITSVRIIIFDDLL